MYSRRNFLEKRRAFAGEATEPGTSRPRPHRRSGTPVNGFHIDALRPSRRSSSNQLARARLLGVGVHSGDGGGAITVPSANSRRPCPRIGGAVRPAARAGVANESERSTAGPQSVCGNERDIAGLQTLRSVDTSNQSNQSSTCDLPLMVRKCTLTLVYDVPAARTLDHRP